MPLFRTRPRWAAVALFVSAGTLLGVGGTGAPADAHAEDGRCVAYSVWIYWADEGREDIEGPRECLTPNTPFHNTFYVPVRHHDDAPPTGWPGGGGVEVWIPIP